MQGHYDRGETFPCHYSKLNPWMVIETFKRDEKSVMSRPGTNKFHMVSHLFPYIGWGEYNLILYYTK